MRFDCRDICAGYPWLRELWLMDAASEGEPPDDAELLAVCDRPPRNVGQGQRKRFLRDLETRSDRRFQLHLATAAQLSRWLKNEARFAAGFRNAVRLYASEEG